MVGIDNNIERVDFIKADIEGWELHFLKGAQKTIERFKPVIYLEIQDVFLKRAGNTSAEMWEFLKGLGYNIDSLDKDGTTLTKTATPKDGDIWCVSN